MHRLVIVAALVPLVAASNACERPAGNDVRASDVLLTSELMPDFVEIPAGPFTMGADPAADPQAFDNEQWPPTTPEARVVDVPLFMIARHETTMAQYAAFARATGRAEPSPAAAGASQPVAFVSWPDAVAYSRWLTAAMAASPAAPPVLRARIGEGWQVTLPTEAEWEKAARGTDRRIYPWGNEPSRAFANFASSGTTPIGQFACPGCAHGLADMSGNVWEWTRSPYQPYPYTPADDRDGLSADALWTIRGGHYGDAARLVRTTVRTGADPGARRAFIGFRVALSQSVPNAP